MSAIRVYLDPEQSLHLDVAEGYTMLVGDDEVLEVYDDMDIVLAMFRTWDHAVVLQEFPPARVVVLPVLEDDEDEEEEDEDEDEDDVIDGEVEDDETATKEA